jgi:squalene synthase HpnC
VSEQGTAARTASEVLSDLAARAPGQAAGENFPVTLRLVPPVPSDRLMRLYAYARFVDDVGDRAAGDRTTLLDDVAEDVLALWSRTSGGPTLPVVAALRPLVEECGVPPQPLLDLIAANRLDQTVASYETFDDLRNYCRYSARPVGRVVLHIAGAATGPNLADSDTVCDALQVLEHCQDVGEDARAGRVYLPAAELRAAHIRPEDLTSTVTSPALRRVVGIQVERAVAMLDAGQQLVRRLHGWARLAVAGYVGGGLATAYALRRADYEVLARHVGPGRLYTAGRALRLLAP